MYLNNVFNAHTSHEVKQRSLTESFRYHLFLSSLLRCETSIQCRKSRMHNVISFFSSSRCIDSLRWRIRDRTIGHSSHRQSKHRKLHIHTIKNRKFRSLLGEDVRTADAKCVTWLHDAARRWRKIGRTHTALSATFPLQIHWNRLSGPGGIVAIMSPAAACRYSGCLPNW